MDSAADQPLPEARSSRKQKREATAQTEGHGSARTAERKRRNVCGELFAVRCALTGLAQASWARHAAGAGRAAEPETTAGLTGWDVSA
jgi:hypothetical protein